MNHNSIQVHLLPMNQKFSKWDSGACFLRHIFMSTDRSNRKLCQKFCLLNLESSRLGLKSQAGSKKLKEYG